MRKPLIAANWKMYKTPADTTAFFESFLPLIAGHMRDEVAVFPSATSIPAAVAAAAGSSVGIGGQNIYWEDQGAFTGETSTVMLKACGATHVLIGHSERRQYFGETDEQVNRKIQASLKHGLQAIVCVGETDAEREAQQTMEVLKRQLCAGLCNLNGGHLENIAIAYEPVWAIGTGKTATPEIAEEAHLHIRQTVAGLCGDVAANALRILYGGSVKPDNAAELMAKPDIDGALVGGASLDPQSFAAIVKYGAR